MNTERDLYNNGKEKDVQMNWYTIPEFQNIRPVNFYGKEYADKQKSQCSIENLHVLARAELDYRKEQGRVLFRITADDYYKLYINGNYTGQGPAPAYPEDYFYNEFDITSLLKEGKNVLALHLYYQGLVNRVWNSGDGRFGAAAQIVAGDGMIEDIRWKYQISGAFSGEVTGYGTQFLENFDGNLWEDDWNSTTYDDSEWEKMIPLSDPGYHLSLQPVKMLDVYVRKPEYIRKDEDGWYIDAGEEITGALRIFASAGSGGKVMIFCGEECREDGSVRWDMRCNVSYKETWTLKPGKNILNPYDYKGFRYARLVPEGEVSIEHVEVVIRHYPMEDECILECSCKIVEDIFKICKNAVKYGTQEGYLDCPTREKGQYLGDAVVTSLSQVWLTGTVEMLRKCIRQFALTSEICPGLMAVAPGSYMQEIADYSLMWPQLLLTDYKFTGDRNFLREYYPVLKGVIDYFGKYRRKDGLLANVNEKWNLVDWPENLRDGYDMVLDRPLTSSVCHNVINALYIGAVQALSRIETILGIPISLDWKELKEAYINIFYDKVKQLFRDSEISRHIALHSNIYALYFHLCPDESIGVITDFLINKGLACGSFTSYFYLKALAYAGRYDAVYKILINQSKNGWGNMIREGATTCFEAWGKDMKWNTSLCHPWSSAPIPVLIEEIAGFKPQPENVKGYSFCPHIPDSIKDFRLMFRFRNKRYEIIKKLGETKLIQYTCKEETE